MTCCINAPVRSLSIIPILPLGCFSTITTKAKASVRLSASGETPQVKTCIDTNWAIIFPSRLKSWHFGSWFFGSWLKHRIQKLLAEKDIKTVRCNGWSSSVLSAVLVQNTRAFRSLAPCWINLRNEEGIYFYWLQSPSSLPCMLAGILSKSSGEKLRKTNLWSHLKSKVNGAYTWIAMGVRIRVWFWKGFLNVLQTFLAACNHQIRAYIRMVKRRIIATFKGCACLN